MDSKSSVPSSSPSVKAPEEQPPAASDSGSDNSSRETPSKLSTSGLTSWAKNLKIPQPMAPAQDSPTGSGQSSFARFTSGLGLRLSPKAPVEDDDPSGSSKAMQPGIFDTITKGIFDSSKSAVKAVQVKARHVVSQNKRRYQVSSLIIIADVVLFVVKQSLHLFLCVVVCFLRKIYGLPNNGF